MYWHGFPQSFDAYLELGHLDTLYANDALDDLIERSNVRPEDMR